MTPIIKQDPQLKSCWRVRKCWSTKSKDCSAYPSEAHVCLRSSTDTLAILTLHLSPAIPPLPPSFQLYLTFAGQQAEASLSASSFPQVIQIHHWPIYNTRQNREFYLPSDSHAVWQPASLPQLEEHILFQHLTDLKPVITIRLTPFSQPLPRVLIHLGKWRSSVCFVVVAVRCWSCQLRRDAEEKEEWVAANTFPKILCPKQRQIWIESFGLHIEMYYECNILGQNENLAPFAPPLSPHFHSLNPSRNQIFAVGVIIKSSSTKYIK